MWDSLKLFGIDWRCTQIIMKYCRAQEDKRNERRERIEQVIREREQQKIDIEQKKWSRKEEAAFAKTILAYGVEYNKREER